VAGDSADLALATAAARAAGETVMRWFGRPLDVRFKEPGQPLTDADLAADRLIREMLLGARPDDGWLSEETMDGPDRLGRRRVWIVDPIDGTRSFIAARPEFSISIGLAVAGRVEVGVVYNPAADELYSAVRGGGAVLERRGAAPLPLRLDGCGATPALTSPDGSVTTSHVTVLASRTEIAAGEFAGLGEGWQVEPVGSTAYKLARVAAGRGDVYLSRGPKSEWDVCAGVLLVQEAGGLVTDLRGREPRFNGADPYVHGILAANAALHGMVLEQTAKLPAAGRLRQEEEG
jgi:myo-inositol-1(or 4)-monophosphatase